MPPRRPRRALSVCRAISSPSGTLIVTTTPRTALRAISSSTIAVMLRRGTGLIAGAPTSRPSPGLVTEATPWPPRRVTPGASAIATSATISAPCVQSGSSPASLTTLHTAALSRRSQRSRGNVWRRPFGRVDSISERSSPRTSTRVAAFAAAAAHAPVVNPSRRPLGSRGGTTVRRVRGACTSRSSARGCERSSPVERRAPGPRSVRAADG